MNTSVDLLAVMDSVLGDLMAAQVAGVDTDTDVNEIIACMGAVAELIESVGQYRLSASTTNRAHVARLNAALARVRGAA